MFDDFKSVLFMQSSALIEGPEASISVCEHCCFFSLLFEVCTRKQVVQSRRDKARARRMLNARAAERTRRCQSDFVGGCAPACCS